MSNVPGRLSHFQQKLRCLSIFQRIALANSLIILVGAVGGTLVTRHLAIEAADVGLILLFATSGTLLSLAVNSWLVRQALRPLKELRRTVDRVQAGQVDEESLLLSDSDPDICQLSAAIESLVGQLEKRNRKLRALSEQVLNAQEEERKRIALSLHDDTGQALSMLIIHLERLETRLPADETETRKKLAAARQLAAHALAELRKIVRDLRPSILDTLGLVPAIRWYARSCLEEAGIRVQIEAQEDCGPQDCGPLPYQMTTALFRIAQEAINNIVRHSKAKSVSISFSESPEVVCLTVIDDGRGFDPGGVNGQSLDRQQWGLVGMRERAELAGGELVVDSQPGKGTQVQVRVPHPNKVILSKSG